MCLAIPVEVVEVIDQDRARASIGGIVREICITLVADVKVGDHVILHVGYALSKLDPEQAERTLETMRSAGVLEQTLVDGSGERA